MSDKNRFQATHRLGTSKKRNRFLPVRLIGNLAITKEGMKIGADYIDLLSPITTEKGNTEDDSERGV